MTELEALRDRVAQLEAILGVDEPFLVQLRLAFGLTGATQPKILGMLLNRSFVTHDALYAMLYGHRPDCDLPCDKTVDVHLSKLRKTLKGHGITFRTVVDGGYAMDTANKIKVRAKLGLPTQSRPHPGHPDFPAIQTGL
ncbi:helix-turn-helix domain-containing protein [Bradyrhizobium septentrionale]|uniref:helix-turn-helix domain-containing protein n=1 Tax=Bradyrhizobium septentrionale TaxID=1404411 RepID=UPI0015964E4C|nr:helix-turn-helix domain-containing protein [Bradyrhizobium septentrionale]UGY23770.1 helix-turn-helix domain-containing protein [Bradyrhizobium septentrionale]